MAGRSFLDLRGNRGGETEGLYYLLSHFLPAGATITTVVTPGVGSERIVAQPVPDALHLSGRPLYVLVDHRTRSAAEAVAHTVRHLKLGEVVGETTEGANHISDDTPIAPYFRLSVPRSYTQDPVSNGNWEGVGVKPTIATAGDNAGNIAHAAAVTRLLAEVPDSEERTSLLWAREGICPAAEPVVLSLADLNGLARAYVAARLERRDTALWLVRADRPAMKLKPLCAPGRFVAADDEMFRVTATPEALELLQPGRPARRFDRQ